MVPAINKSSKAGTVPAYIRRAHHAGSWYESDTNALDELLSQFLREAQRENAVHLSTEVVVGRRHNGTATAIESTEKNLKPLNHHHHHHHRAIIAPHAGYRYSGSTAAYAYLSLKQFLSEHLQDNPSSATTVTLVVLHPSHHCYLDGCAVSGASSVETPFADILVDDPLRLELLNTGDFSIMDRRMDEEEHSGEMQYPWISKMFQDYCKASICSGSRGGADIRVLPIMVGALSTVQEEQYGRILSSILARPFVFTIVSSDFCHWGSRFRFTPLPTQPKQEIYEYIEWMDRIGMNSISMQEPGAFASYLKQYNNTICGRHPIGVWLHASEKLQVTFVHYQQSSRVQNTSESSVSYAAAVARILNSPLP